MERLYIIIPASAADSALFKLIGSSAFIPVNKIWSHDKLSMYDYELWIMYNRI